MENQQLKNKIMTYQQLKIQKEQTQKSKQKNKRIFQRSKAAKTKENKGNDSSRPRQRIWVNYTNTKTNSDIKAHCNLYSEKM